MKPLPPVRTYAVQISGFGEVLFSARTPGKARARCYRAFTEFYRRTFHEFLVTSRVWKVENPTGCGERILVTGQPATRCLGPQGHVIEGAVYFMRDDSHEILRAHWSEVSAVATSRTSRCSAGSCCGWISRLTPAT